MNSANAEVIITTFVLSLVLIISLIGNGLTIIATLMNAKLRSYTCLLVCNLAVSDFLITCINLPIRMCQLFGLDWATRGMVQCKASVAITCFLFTTSNSNLFLITLDRFLGVSFPLRYRSLMTIRKLTCAVLISWAYALVVASFPFVVTGQKPSTSSLKNHTIEVCTFSTAFTPAYVLFIEFGTFFTSWFMMLAMYMCILRILYTSRNSKLRSVRQLSEHNSDNRGFQSGNSVRSHKGSVCSISRGINFMKAIRREVKLAKSILIILTLYTILLVPIATIDVVDTISEATVIPPIAIKIALVLAYTNPAVNPPVYVMTSGRYRTAFTHLLCCFDFLTSRRNTGEQSTTVVFSRYRRRFNREVIKTPPTATATTVIDLSHRFDSEYV